MATDKSQNMDVIGKQELGWLVPRVLKPGADAVTGLERHRRSTRTGSTGCSRTARRTRSPAHGVNNGEAYVAKLPGRRILDPAEGAVRHARLVVGVGQRLRLHAGGDGHNLDIHVPALADLPAGTPVTLTFKSTGTSSGTTTTASCMAPTTDNGE